MRFAEELTANSFKLKKVETKLLSHSSAKKTVASLGKLDDIKKQAAAGNKIAAAI